ncbi:protein MONOCULM 1-like [Zingiber officinale]|uniref:protein MONOCULM 1-like n=1 Tax=Zingiber officinale TaxID=94328 RepID=UPI001C4BB3CC|nr:protein MONOCULM 1-like [Zingiber officinale]
MLSSLMSSTGGGKAGAHQHDSSLQHCDPVFSSFPVRQLLIRCADLVHHGDLPAAGRAISSLLSVANTGSDDATDRLVRQFCRALSFRIAGRPGCCPPSSSAYFLFNHIAPFLRFAHLTANQAILEAAAGCRQVHILDLDAHHGLQWPPLLQAISAAGDIHRPPSIRITGAGSDFETLCRTGHRLSAFAHSCDLDFDFRPLLLPDHRPNYDRILNQLVHGETLLVNCVLFLHKLQNEELLTFLRTLKAIKPAVVTVAEREMPPLPTHSSPDFIQQFAATVEHYSAMFESLEATFPPWSRERSEVEQSWLGREIQGAVAGGESHRWSEKWEFAMRSAGFKSIPPSRFAVSQGRMLLRLHYPTEGYNVEVEKEKEEFFFLRWKNKPLYSVSSWK